MRNKKRNIKRNVKEKYKRNIKEKYKREIELVKQEGRLERRPSCFTLIYYFLAGILFFP